MNLAVAEDPSDPLCCCEYYDFKNERNHMLACCCNCDAFDELVVRMLCCRPVDKKLRKEMWLTIKDRFRCPYPGGARQFVFLETLIPLILIVICQLVAAVNIYCTVVIFVGTILILIYTRRRHCDTSSRTNFFSLWCAWSAAYLLALFQLNVPILEILPEENFCYVILLTLTFACYFKTRHRSGVVRSEDVEHLMMEEGKKLPLDPIDEGEYEVWINVIINRHNYRYYVAGCIFGMLMFLVYADLVLTAVCHPMILTRFGSYDLLIPDQCIGVYDHLSTALSFTGGVQALLLAIFIFGKLIQEVFFITRGISTKRPGDRISRKNCLSNWKSFLCN